MKMILARHLCALSVGAMLSFAAEAADKTPWVDWPAESDGAGFTVVQTEGEGDRKEIVVTNTTTNTGLTLSADGKMTAPAILESFGGWPQIELRVDGPAEFQWRKLYRVEKGSYRCVRIDELTALDFQAPENARRVDLGEDYSLYLIRSRELKPGQPDGIESFSVDTSSPDKAFTARIAYNPQYLNKVEIFPASGDGDAQVIYDFDNGEEGSMDSVCQVLWNPDSRSFAFYLTEGARVGGTAIYRYTGKNWQKTELPKIDYPVAKRMAKLGAKWQDQFVRPLRWTDAETLEVELSGFFAGDDGEDYRYLATIRWDQGGKGKVVKLTELPIE